MTPCSLPTVPPHRKPEPMWVWSPRATGVHCPSLPPPLTPQWALEEGGQSTSIFLLSGPPPQTTHTWSPPNQSAFQRKFTPYVSDSFTLQLAMGGAECRTPCLQAPPPTAPIGRLECMCPKGHIFQGYGAVKAGPLQPDVPPP